MQQGFLAFLYLGRLMKHPQGFSANEAFRFDGQSALKTDELYFDGNSQGAILGGALTAVAQDFTRSVLAEAGMNYNVLLDRSSDFDDYLNLVLQPNYPKRYDRIIGIAVAQLLWDRGDTNGYANHITGESAARHAGAHRVAARRGRRPPGHRVQPADRSRDAGRRRARTHRRGRPRGRGRSRLAAHADRPVPVRRLGVLLVGHRLAAVTGRQRAVARGPRSARRHAQHPRRAGAEETSSGTPTAPSRTSAAAQACTAPIPPENAD